MRLYFALPHARPRSSRPACAAEAHAAAQLTSGLTPISNPDGANAAAIGISTAASRRSRPDDMSMVGSYFSWPEFAEGDSASGGRVEQCRCLYASCWRSWRPQSMPSCP